MAKHTALWVVFAIVLASALAAEHADAASCSSDFDCTSSATPICLSGTCSAGPNSCVGDDAADAGNGDDGPVDARSLSAVPGTPATLTGSICGTPSYEADWFKTVVASGSGLTVQLTWSGSDNLDLAAFDSSGTAQGYSLHQQPETVTLSYLPAGSYYFRVLNSTAPASTSATAYTFQLSVTSPQVCTSSADCAATFGTQLFRGNCSIGSCHADPGIGLPTGSSCDGDSECASGLCSYAPFESGADRSVCTTACASDADCGGVGAGFHCTHGFAQNRCEPGCTGDLQCGADTQSTAVTAGQPWLYYTCTSANACLDDRIFASGFQF